MIYCITQPLDKYSVDFGAVNIGPWADMSSNPVLFSMVSFFTPLLYQWEEGSPVPLMARNVDVKADVAAQLMATARRGLYNSVTCLEDLIRTSASPSALATSIDNQEFWNASLPIYGTYTREQLQMVFHARVLSWMKAHGQQAAIEWGKLYEEDEQFVKEHAYGSYKVR